MRSNEIINSALYRKVTSERNIYAAIYALNSYVFERGLLDAESIEQFTALQDKYNFELINSIIRKCQTMLKKIFCDRDTFFATRVVFKAKKYDSEAQKTVFRPMHTADIISQICMVCMLNCIMFNDSDTNGRTLSNISALLPSNFYGNMPSDNVEELFIDWKKNYKRYSEDVEFKYHECMSTGEYEYEIKFDLENFFPSINPEIIYNMIVLKLQTEHPNQELDALKILVFKLLHLKITGLTIDEQAKYYDGNPNDGIVRGIPQGLPQSYFFGNLCMSEIAKCYQKLYFGAAFFYVDDSVIFTKQASNDQKEFQRKIEELNSNINQSLKKYEGSKELPQGYGANLKPKVGYQIKIHGIGKSSLEHISAQARGHGKGYLKNIAMDASRIGFEFRSTLNESEEFTLKEKISVWLDGINAEISRIQDFQSDSIVSYLRSLRRYQKYFRYRLRVIEFGFDTRELKQYTDEFFKRCEYWLHEASLEEILEDIEAEIFLPEACMLLQLSDSQKIQKEIIQMVEDIEQKLFGIGYQKEHLYFFNSVHNLFMIDEDAKYRSLKSISKKYYSFAAKKSEAAELKELLTLATERERELFPEYLPEYTRFIFNHSKSFSRLLFNMKLSFAIGTELSDSACFSKKNGYVLKYFEIRILMLVRNKYFDVKSDLSLIQDIIKDAKSHKSSCEKMDYSITEVLGYFHTYIKKPKLVDQLILTHQYVAGVWRNGSKFLYFYTLHSEEHSIELIKISISILKTIDYFQIKEHDYFILFLACYLHDISMVYYPNLNIFSKDGVESDVIYTSWKDDVTKLLDANKSFAETNKHDIKMLILKYFTTLDTYFETTLRNKHSNDSGKLIRSISSLNFLDVAIRTLVAEVSVAHGYGTRDVYNLKSSAKDNTISAKYIMIILRLADLLDMTKDRVSMKLLKQNIKNMPEESKFHWISHAAIERCVIKTEYTHKSDAKHHESHLGRDKFLEEFVIEIYLNSKIISAVQGPICTRYSAVLHDGDAFDTSKITIRPISGGSRCKTCIFGCKWMHEKNRYLFNELEALKRYLERNSNNMFNTTYRVDIKYEREMALEAEYLECIQNKIDSN